MQVFNPDRRNRHPEACGSPGNQYGQHRITWLCAEIFHILCQKIIGVNMHFLRGAVIFSSWISLATKTRSSDAKLVIFCGCHTWLCPCHSSGSFTTPCRTVSARTPSSHPRDTKRMAQFGSAPRAMLEMRNCSARSGVAWCLRVAKSDGDSKSLQLYWKSLQSLKLCSLFANRLSCHRKDQHMDLWHWININIGPQISHQFFNTNWIILQIFLDFPP